MTPQPLATRLSVNLNKVALLRNQRDIGYPSVTGTAQAVLRAGAGGVTVHPRPDARHTRPEDVAELAALLRGWPGREFNVEGYPAEAFLRLVETHRPDQVTLVPDTPEQRTSDHGWDFTSQSAVLGTAIPRLKAIGARVSLFIDPDPMAPGSAMALGADAVELYTGPYAFAQGPAGDALLAAHGETARAAQALGMEVNAGHDLNLSNLTRFLRAVPGVAEVSIGHAITADALAQGWRAAVEAYRTAIRRAG